MIDHRASPGIPGLPKLFESAIFICGHCQATVVKNPDRTRERSMCRKCNNVLCDGCGFTMSKTLECRDFNRVIDETLERAVRTARSIGA